MLLCECCSDIPPDIDFFVISIFNKEKMSKDKEICEFLRTNHVNYVWVNGGKFHNSPFRYIFSVLYLKSMNVIENVNYESDSNGHVGNMCVYSQKNFYLKKSDLYKSCQIACYR